MRSPRVASLPAAVLVLLTAAAVWALPPVGTTPVVLDAEPLRPPAFISAGALDGTVLVAWNSTASGALTVHWTMVDADGGLLKPPDAGPLGEFSFYPVHVAPAPDAGLWLVVLPDKSGGGALGGARIFADGGQPDGFGAYLGMTPSVRYARGVWLSGEWLVLEARAGTTNLMRVDSTLAATQPAPVPPLADKAFELATDDERAYVAWPDDAGRPVVDLLSASTGRAPAIGAQELASSVAVAAAPDAVLLAWTSATAVRLRRFTWDLQPLDPAPLTVDQAPCDTVRASFDGRDFLLTWVCGQASAAQVRVGRLAPLAAFPAEVTTHATGPVSAPDIAGIHPGAALLAWAAGDAGAQLPLYTVLEYDAHDAGGVLDAGATDAGTADAGVPDAGSSSDGGSNADAGTELDAGSDVDAGAEPDGGVHAPVAKHYLVGCAGAPGLAAWPLLLLAALLALSTRSRSRR